MGQGHQPRIQTMKPPIGNDRGAENHAARVVDERGRTAPHLVAEHTAEGLATRLASLAKFGPAAGPPVAIERPNGLVMEAGHPVVPIHPDALKARRPRYRAAGGTCDPGDACILADVLRTDGHRFQPLEAAEEEVRGPLARTLVPIIRALNDRIRNLRSAIEPAVAEASVATIVMSLPRAGESVTAAPIAAELGEDPARFATANRLAAAVGVAPVTHASGKSLGVTSRHARNKRPRVAIPRHADNSRHEREWAKGIYRRARARGGDHPHAVRILARAGVRVLWRGSLDGVPCDPAPHGGAKGVTPPPEPAVAA